MAKLERIGNRWREHLGYSDHHLMYRILPEGFTPGLDDAVVKADGTVDNGIDEAEPGGVEQPRA